MTIRGAVYLPARAFNAYQMWKDYDPAVIERDLGYAQSLGLHAIRIWVSYEYRLAYGEKNTTASFEHLLTAASARGLKVVPSLFEGCGIAPTTDSLNNTDPLTAVCVYSPAKDIYEQPERYSEPSLFVKEFMQRYRNDDRLLAIEIMNEPSDVMRIRFVRAILQSALLEKGNVPLTMGCASVEDHLYYQDIGGLDILQNHLNFPASPEEIESRMKLMAKVSNVLGLPCWMTEWQRIRTGQRVSGGAAPLGWNGSPPTKPMRSF
jgi:hypothetical protein